MKIRPHIVLSVFWAIILLLNHTTIHSALLGAFVLLLYAISCSMIVKRRVFPLVRGVMGFVLGLLGVLSVFIILSTIIYYGHSWSVMAMALTLLVLPLLLALMPKDAYTFYKEPEVISLHFSTSGHSFFGLFVLGLQMILFSALFRSAVSHSIISPWEALPSYFFPLFVITTFLLALHYVLYRHKTHFFLGFLHIVMMLTVAFIIFPTGYGFDPFIHRAAEMHILENDVITPKTPYYIGQYTVIVTAARLISPEILSLLDRLLVPILSALILLSASIYSLRRLEFDIGVALSGIVLFILPFSPFIVTTPQGFANTLFAGLIILSLTRASDKPVPMAYLWMLALASACVHPLTGVPAIIFMLLVSVWQTELPRKISALTMGAIFVGSSIILPILLLFSSGQSSIANRFTEMAQPSFGWDLSWLRPLDPALDILYTYRYFLIFIVLGLLFYGLRLVYTRSRFAGIAGILSGLFVVLVINAALLASGMELPLIIDYEQGNYSVRVMQIALIVLFPFLLLLAQRATHRLYHTEPLVRIIGIGALSFALAGGLYFSYPRNNPVERAHGYSVSQADFDTVSEIEKHADGASYVVLANQAVSAAAVESLGFDHYIETEDGLQYFYPIPTGGALYEYFLDMIYGQPTQAVAESVMSYMNVDRVYFVINDYWWDSEKIISQAFENTDTSFQIDSTNKVFVYKKTAP